MSGDPRILLLRGINLGPNRRIAMPELRAALTEAGHAEVRTYVQSGNIVLRSRVAPEELETATAQLIQQRFGLDVPVLARTGGDLARVVDANPLAGQVTDPKRHQVTFLAAPLHGDVIERLNSAAAPREAVVVEDREVYAWHPEGVARSKLWNALAGSGLGVVATSRNWTTVQTLHTMASEL